MYETLEWCLTYICQNSHITKVCSAAYYHLRNICRIRNLLILDSAKSITHTFVTARLDYCNSLMFGSPPSQKLQRVQNMAAKMVSRKKKFDHVTPIFKFLHWLPVEYHIQFKVLLLTFRAMNGIAPQHLTDIISTHQPRQLLRNSHALELNIPKSRLRSAGDRTFSLQAASLWHQLPADIRNLNELSLFKSKLKHTYFRKHLIV